MAKQEEKTNQEWKKVEISSKRKPEETRKPAKKARTETIEEERKTEGKQKRKQYENRKEFENACKRQRPNFDPENELEHETASLPAVPTIKQKFFSIFKNENEKNSKEKSSKILPISNQKKTRKNKANPAKVELSRLKGGGLRHITSFFQPIENKLRLSCGSTKAVNLPEPKWGEKGGGGHSSCKEATGRCDTRELKIRNNENFEPRPRKKVKDGGV